MYIYKGWQPLSIPIFKYLYRFAFIDKIFSTLLNSAHFLKYIDSYINFFLLNSIFATTFCRRRFNLLLFFCFYFLIEFFYLIFISFIYLNHLIYSVNWYFIYWIHLFLFNNISSLCWTIDELRNQFRKVLNK